MDSKFPFAVAADNTELRTHCAAPSSYYFAAAAGGGAAASFAVDSSSSYALAETSMPSAHLLEAQCCWTWRKDRVVDRMLHSVQPFRTHNLRCNLRCAAAIASWPSYLHTSCQVTACRTLQPV